MKAADNNAADPQVWSTDRRHCGSRFHEGFVQYLGFAPKTKEIKILSAPTAKNKFEGTHSCSWFLYFHCRFRRWGQKGWWRKPNEEEDEDKDSLRGLENQTLNGSSLLISTNDRKTSDHPSVEGSLESSWFKWTSSSSRAAGAIKFKIGRNAESALNHPSALWRAPHWRKSHHNLIVFSASNRQPTHFQRLRSPAITLRDKEKLTPAKLRLSCWAGTTFYATADWLKSQFVDPYFTHFPGLKENNWHSNRGRRGHTYIYAIMYTKTKKDCGKHWIWQIWIKYFDQDTTMDKLLWAGYYHNVAPNRLDRKYCFLYLEINQTDIHVKTGFHICGIKTENCFPTRYQIKKADYCKFEIKYQISAFSEQKRARLGNCRG